MAAKGVIIRTFESGEVIRVDEDGYFLLYPNATSEERIGSSKALDPMLELIRKRHQNARIKISVKFTSLKTGMPGEVTGQHARTGQWMVKEWDARDQKYVTGQVAGYSLTEMNRIALLSEEEAKQLRDIIQKRDELYKKIEEFRNKHPINVKEEVAAAWKAAGGAAD